MVLEKTDLKMLYNSKREGWSAELPVARHVDRRMQLNAFEKSNFTIMWSSGMDSKRSAKCIAPSQPTATPTPVLIGVGL